MVGVVAGGVFAVLDVDGVVGHLLDASAHKPAVALLGGHALDFGLLGGEVVGDGVHLVGGRTLGELGLRDDGPPFQRVGLAVGVDQLGIHVDLHVVGLEVAVLVGDVALVVDVDLFAAQVVDQRIGILTRDGVVEERLGRTRPGGGVGRLSAERVGGAERIGLERHERIELRPGDGIAHFLRQGVEASAAAGFLAGGPALAAGGDGVVTL